MHLRKDNINFPHIVMGYEQAINTQKYAVVGKADVEKDRIISITIK